MRNQLFAAIAKVFPTERVGENRVLSVLWRFLFYGLSPSEPFVMRTEHYKIMAHPKKGTLTRAVIRRGYCEKTVTDAFIEHLRPNALVVDAGANFGNYTLVAAKYVGAKGRVIAFEPNAETFALLRANIALLDHDNVTAVQAGLSDCPGEMALVIDRANPGGHSFTQENVGEVGARITTPIDSLDHYLSSHQIDTPVSLIKIDVQGFEGKVIRGAAGVILRDRPVVFVEVMPEAMANAGDDYRAQMAFFKDADYRMQFVTPGDGGVADVSYDDATAMLAEPDRQGADLIFVPAGP